MNNTKKNLFEQKLNPKSEITRFLKYFARSHESDFSKSLNDYCDWVLN
jgi:hypothetical protein